LKYRRITWALRLSLPQIEDPTLDLMEPLPNLVDKSCHSLEYVPKLATLRYLDPSSELFFNIKQNRVGHTIFNGFLLGRITIE